MTITNVLPIAGAEAASSVLIAIILLFGPSNFVPLNALVLGSNPYSSRFQTLFFKTSVIRLLFAACILRL